MNKNLILFLLAANTLLTTVPAAQSDPRVIRKGTNVLVLPNGSVVTSISFKTPPVTQLSADAPIYFFTTSRISDTDEVVTLLTDTSTQEEKNHLKNILDTFAPDRENFAVSHQHGTANLHVESKSRVLTRQQLIGLIEKECQKDNLREFLEANAQIIVTEETLTKLATILRK